MNICQSCGMPIDSDDLKGTNEDGSLNQEYCTYCFHDGKFTHDFTMDQMIFHSVSLIDRMNVGTERKIDREEAIRKMRGYFPKLKRWRKME
ncbi:MAG: transcriptional regulator [Bacteroidales bacterium]|nr:transcriptional regulator [Bacteroidales bacterium]